VVLMADHNRTEADASGDEGSSISPQQGSSEQTKTFDLGNLVTADTSALDIAALSSTRGYLDTLARDNAQNLVAHIFNLPSEEIPTIQGRLATLPAPTMKLPREKPIPKPKPETKWEKFRKEKGIQKRKKGRMVWDEQKQQYLPRYGYKRANNLEEQWAFEAKGDDDGKEDPWQRMQREKNDRVSKNQKQHLSNLKAASGERLPGTIDLTSAAGASRPGKRNQQGKAKPKHHVDVALAVAQKSTASMGRFDERRPLEVPRKLDKRPRDSELQHSIAADKQRSLAVLDRVIGKSAEHFDANKAANLAKVVQDKANRKRKLSESSKLSGGGKAKKARGPGKRGPS